jgi:hypothetical protein
MESGDEASISLTFEVVLNRFVAIPVCMAAASSKA